MKVSNDQYLYLSEAPFINWNERVTPENLTQPLPPLRRTPFSKTSSGKSLDLKRTNQVGQYKCLAYVGRSSRNSIDVDVHVTNSKNALATIPTTMQNAKPAANPD